MIRNTASEECPWYVLPASDKWFARMAVASVLVETLEQLGLEFPQLGGEQRADLDEGRRLLSSES